MNDLQRTVWTKLQQYRIDEPIDGPQGPQPPAFGFDRRLARENGWSVPFARRVIEEYKRFLYLALFGGHPVCPSEEVDQCWHMHMTFTRSYWDRLCKDILNMPLHHDPSRGGREEDLKHDDMYTRTKAAYTRAFGAPPPEDIWPTGAARFDRSRKFRRVDLSTVYMVPRHKAHTAAGIAGALVIGGTIAGCSRAAGSNAATSFIIFICIIAALMVISLIVQAIRRSQIRGCSTSGGCGGGSCGAGWFFGSDGGSSSSSESGGSHHGHGGHGHGSDGGHSGDGGDGCDSGGHGCSGSDGGGSGCGGGGDVGGGGCGGGGCGGGGCGGGGD